MRLRLWTVVEAKHSFDNVLQFRRNLDGTGASTIRASRWVLVLLELNGKSLVHGGDSPGKNDGPPRGAFFFHGKVVHFGEGFDAGDAVRIGAVKLLKFFAAQNWAFRDRLEKVFSVVDWFLPSARNAAGW